jgi:peptidoglycan/LPS O-acetylase OafA/YrhL
VNHNQFRGDIQGLRGISVLSVVLFHLSDRLAPGGFVGVDIFFSISGYIITTLLLREYEASGHISLGGFLARRARRLLPNATAVLAFILIAGLVVIPNYDYPLLVGDVKSAALYYSNFHFLAAKLEYFKSNLEPSAVVHFWSLSIEEQFYFVWPAVVLLTCNLSRRYRYSWMTSVGAMLLAIWVVSFVSCIIVVRYNQPLAFFGSGTRVWELASGALLAVFRNSVGSPVSRYREEAGVLGLGLIVLSFWFLDENKTHPGVLTLLPVLGTLLVIAAGTGADYQPRVAKLLSARWLNWFGDRSYSIYLWHWPMIIFANRLIDGRPILAGISAVIGTLILSELAYRFIETPIHRGQWNTRRVYPQIALAACSVAGVLMLGILIENLSNVLLGREDARSRWSESIKIATNDDGAPYRDKCHLDGSDVMQPECLYGDKGAARTAILFGDSHAAHWFPALEKVGLDHGWAVRSWSKSVCPAARIHVWDPYRKTRYVECDQWRAAIIARILKMEPRPVVFLSSSNGYSGWTQSIDGKSVLNNRAAEDDFERGLTETAKALVGGGATVYIIRDTPLADVKYKQCIVRRLGGVGCERPRSRAINQNEIEKRVAEALNVGFIDVSDIICEKTTCPVVKDGMIVYRDDSHMTATFARTLAPTFKEALQSPKASAAD